jgi:hypothetical protein
MQEHRALVDVPRQYLLAAALILPVPSAKADGPREIKAGISPR